MLVSAALCSTCHTVYDVGFFQTSHDMLTCVHLGTEVETLCSKISSHVTVPGDLLKSVYTYISKTKHHLRFMYSKKLVVFHNLCFRFVPN